jgi:hypothetical protein
MVYDLHPRVVPDGQDRAHASDTPSSPHAPTPGPDRRSHQKLTTGDTGWILGTFTAKRALAVALTLSKSPNLQRYAGYRTSVKQLKCLKTFSSSVPVWPASPLR